MSSDNNATAPNVTEEVTKNVPEQTEKPTTPDEETYTPSGTTEVWDSKKQQAFVESGLKDPTTQEYKKCIEMGGVGPRTMSKLAYRGIEFAYQLIGRYMENKLDDEKMDDWLHNELHVRNKDHRATITGTMRKWTGQHL